MAMHFVFRVLSQYILIILGNKKCCIAYSYDVVMYAFLPFVLYIIQD